MFHLYTACCSQSINRPKGTISLVRGKVNEVNEVNEVNVTHAYVSTVFNNTLQICQHIAQAYHLNDDKVHKRAECHNTLLLR